MAEKLEIRIVQKGAKTAAKEQKTLSKSVNTTAKSIGAMATSMVTAYVSYRSFVTITQKSIGLARSYTRETAKLNAVLEGTNNAVGLTSNQLQAMAADLESIIGISDETIKSAQSLLLTFKTIGDEIFERTLRASANLATVLGSDLRSAAMQLGKALEDPTLGLTMLRRSGVSFSKAEQQVIKDLVETNELLKAQELILEKVEGQIGNTAEAVVDDFTKASVATNNFFEELGKKIQSGATGKLLTTWIQGVNELVKTMQGTEAQQRAFVASLTDDELLEWNKKLKEKKEEYAETQNTIIENTKNPSLCSCN